MKKHLLFLLILALSLQVVFSEVVLLKDGSILKGTLTNASADSITLTTDNAGAIVIAKSSIKKIFQTEADYLAETSSTSTKPVETAKTEEKKGEKSDEYSDSGDDDITVTDSDEYTQKETKKAVRRAKREKKREINEQASDVHDSYFFPGYALAITAPLSVLISGFVYSANTNNYMLMPVFLGLTMASAAIGTAPYGGPIALTAIYGLSAIVIGAMVSPILYFYNTDIWRYTTGPLITCALVAVLEIVATIIEFAAASEKDEYKERKRKEQRISMFAAPGFTGTDFKDTELVAGLTIRL